MPECTCAAKRDAAVSAELIVEYWQQGGGIEDSRLRF